MSDAGAQTGELFAVHDSSLVISRDADVWNCTFSLVNSYACDFLWLDNTGATTAQVSSKAPQSIRDDASVMLLSPPLIQTCSGSMPVWSVSETLVDLGVYLLKQIYQAAIAG